MLWLGVQDQVGEGLGQKLYDADSLYLMTHLTYRSFTSFFALLVSTTACTHLGHVDVWSYFDPHHGFLRASPMSTKPKYTNSMKREMQSQ